MTTWRTIFRDSLFPGHIARGLQPFTAQTRRGYCVKYVEAVVQDDGPNRDREEAPMPNTATPFRRFLARTREQIQ